MEQSVRDRLAKIYTLINAGATNGEKQAAKNALDRIIEKYNICEEDLKSLDKKKYIFKYSTEMELWLLIRLMNFFSEEAFKNSGKNTYRTRQIESQLTYIDGVTIESAYEYFRRHMKTQWNRICMPELKKCRKQKTMNIRRKELQNLFFQRYIINSNLVPPEALVNVDLAALSEKELKDRMIMSGVEGGNYKTQIISSYLLTN